MKCFEERIKISIKVIYPSEGVGGEAAAQFLCHLKNNEKKNVWTCFYHNATILFFLLNKDGK